MKPAPPRLIERIVALLLPPSCREHVLGDLHERYSSTLQYIVDALCVLPGVVFSQIRRTTSPQRFMADGLIIYASFLAVALWGEGPLFLNAQGGLRLAFPTVATLIGFVLAEAYVMPSNRGPNTSLLNGLLAMAVSVLSQTLLLAFNEPLTVSKQIIIFGGSISAILLSASRLSGSRLLFPPPSPISPMRDLAERSKALRKNISRGNFELFFAAALLSAMGIVVAARDGATDRAVGGAIIATGVYIIYQVYRKASTPVAGPEPIEPSAALYRAQLERRRDALRTLWSWYVLPYLGGLLAFALRLPLSHPERPDLLPNIIPFVVLSIAWSIAVKVLSARAAKKLQDEIDSL